MFRQPPLPLVLISGAWSGVPPPHDRWIALMEINYDRIMVPPPPAKKRQTGREDETDLAGLS